MDKPLDTVQGDIKMEQGVSLAIYRFPNDVGEQVTNFVKKQQGAKNHGLQIDFLIDYAHFTKKNILLR